MNVHDALDRLDAIQEQLSRSAPVRGYRAATVACTAVAALAGAFIQTARVTDPLHERPQYLAIWVGIALLAVAAIAVEVGLRFHASHSRLERHGLVRTLFTLLPPFGTAGVVTAALAAGPSEVFALLPGLWMLSFALAVFASLPRLPHGVGYIGCLYFACGSWALAQPATVALAPWTMGGVFALGQAAAAWLLSRNPEGSEFPRLRGEDRS